MLVFINILVFAPFIIKLYSLINPRSASMVGPLRPIQPQTEAACVIALPELEAEDVNEHLALKAA
jgi:hypothetical protein